MPGDLNPGNGASSAAGEINGYLRDLLRGYNDRDTEAVGRHIKTLRDALERGDGDVVPTRFGGSVSKHTYVQGLSDVDALFIVNASRLSGQSPEDAIAYMANAFRQRLPRTKISAGDLAVAVKFSDGIEIQVLPAIRTKSGIRIADPERDGWSKVLHPERFARKLTEVNQANRGQVIPTIKLAKALAVQVIPDERKRISGYHMESLAIEAFRNYPGPYDLHSMLGRFCASAAVAVQQPITDSTGQSRYVDEYLGKARSRPRREAANYLKAMGQRLNACESIRDLEDLFGNGGGRNDNPAGGGSAPKAPGGKPNPATGGRKAVVRAATSAIPAVAPTRTFHPPRPYATPSSRQDSTRAQGSTRPEVERVRPDAIERRQHRLARYQSAGDALRWQERLYRRHFPLPRIVEPGYSAADHEPLASAASGDNGAV